MSNDSTTPSNDGTLMGVMILTRHGDREGFYQDPLTYTASLTSITPLGTVQEFQLGQQLRGKYLNSHSPLFIPGIAADLFDQTQIHVRADAGGELGVIYDSAVALLQGLFPATPSFTTTLANGTTVEGALGGYQYVPIESVEPANDVSLEGYTNCATFDAATLAFYNSPEFLQKANDSAHFLSLLPPFLDGRPVTLVNIYNIFDYVNVNFIHNATFANSLPPTFLQQVRDLANFHEHGVFTSAQLNGIGNIAGRTILPVMIQELQAIANASNPLKIAYQSLAYKPFLSLFNMTGAAQQNPRLANMVNYAAAVVLEVRQPAGGGDAVLRLKFKNGTDEADFTTYNFLGQTHDVPLTDLINFVDPALINSTSAWCAACNNTQDRGCAALTKAAATGQVSRRDGLVERQGVAERQGLAERSTVFADESVGYQHQAMISPVSAGLVGMSATLAMLGMLMLLGFISVGKGRHSRKD
ncbi:histidine phosphatase superfamily [Roridomyces roridus]|uniref:Histidine phosphatase superfamily n=1 Tax=Roridomyces roridus TaxID=1738132 RepID=A0AAD7FYL0_9AGAR|nr:histidine phosphatase superfamily [Roridomyces roridus]